MNSKNTATEKLQKRVEPKLNELLEAGKIDGLIGTGIGSEDEILVLTDQMSKKSREIVESVFEEEKTSLSQRDKACRSVRLQFEETGEFRAN